MCTFRPKKVAQVKAGAQLGSALPEIDANLGFKKLYKGKN
ncbi:MAG: hypothetical protein Ct9H300mP29_1530 [Candidatus Neomarinimicrobiota bacterium]|nr:MAG: hypothetical protein Ct9H300mP29_1530 [Candidatus Neomarinimicrobiota bacterium]